MERERKSPRLQCGSNKKATVSSSSSARNATGTGTETASDRPAVKLLDLVRRAKVQKGRHKISHVGAGSGDENVRHALTDPLSSDFFASPAVGISTNTGSHLVPPQQLKSPSPLHQNAELSQKPPPPPPKDADGSVPIGYSHATVSTTPSGLARRTTMPMVPTTPDTNDAAGQDKNDRSGFFASFGLRRSNSKKPRSRSLNTPDRKKLPQIGTPAKTSPTVQSMPTIAAAEVAAPRSPAPPNTASFFIPPHRHADAVRFDMPRPPPPTTSHPVASPEAQPVIWAPVDAVAAIAEPPAPAFDAQREPAYTEEGLPDDLRPSGQNRSVLPRQHRHQLPREQQMLLSQVPAKVFETPPPAQDVVPCRHCKAAFEAALEESRDSLQDLSVKLDSAYDEMRRYIDLLHARDATIAAQAMHMAEQVADLAEEKERVERLQVHLQEQAVRAMDREREAITGDPNSSGGIDGLSAGSMTLYSSGLASNTQLPDVEIFQRWKLLHWRIQQCVEARLPTGSSSHATWRSVLPQRAPLLRQLTPEFESFLRARDGGSMNPANLALAAVWAFLAENVFGRQRQASPMLWAGQMAEPLGRIENDMLRLRSHDPAFHLWRAQTAAFVRGLSHGALAEDQRAAATTYSDDTANQLALDVGFLLEPGGHSAGSSSDDLRRQLGIIVEMATALDADLCQQRAWFYVHYPTAATTGQRHGMAFDPHVMKDVAAPGSDDSNEPDESDGTAGGGDDSTTGEAKAAVLLVVRPSLFKVGNGRGEAYDQGEAVQPSLVCLVKTPSRRFLRLPGTKR